MLKSILTKDKGQIVRVDFNISEFLVKREGYISGEDFAGMKYPYLDGCPYKSFLASRNKDIVANVLAPEKEIIFLPYKNPLRNEYPNLFYDQTKAMGDGGIFQYEGNFEDALNELKKDDFLFLIGRVPNLYEVVDFKSRKVSSEKSFPIVKKDASIDELFEFFNKL